MGRELKRFARTENERVAIRGEANLGEYARTMGQGAASGAAGGAVGGALFGGIGAAPGALLGGIAGGVGNGLLKGVSDLRYTSMNPQDKASWQAGDLQDKLEKIASIVSARDPSLASLLTQRGQDYKQYVDATIQKAAVNVTKNVFNADPAAQRASYLAERAELQARRARDLADTIRLAQAATPAADPDQAEADAQALAEKRKSTLKDMASSPAASETASTGAKKLLPTLAEQAPKAATGLLTHVGSLLGAGVSILVDQGIDWLSSQVEKLNGELNELKPHVEDARRIIREVNRLTDNNTQVREAGNQIFSHLQDLLQSYQQAAAKVASAKSQAQAAPAAPTAPPAAQPPRALLAVRSRCHAPLGHDGLLPAPRGEVISPCVKRCRLEAGVCSGCLRTSDEIGRWLDMDDAERRAAMARAAGVRRAQGEGNEETPDGNA